MLALGISARLRLAASQGGIGVLLVVTIISRSVPRERSKKFNPSAQSPACVSFETTAVLRTSMKLLVALSSWEGFRRLKAWRHDEASFQAKIGRAHV